MGNPNQMDFGGLDLVVNTIRSGATEPGQTGTDITSTIKVEAIDLDSTTATLASNAATITKHSAVITTESLSTAAAGSQALVITLDGVAAGDLAFVTRAGGSNTRHNYQLDAVTTANTVTVTVYNTEPTNALNGTLIFNLLVMKK